MSAVGRNDPCPCGSGRKFKKCCLGKAHHAPGPHASGDGAYTPRDRDSALSRLARFSVRPEFETDHHVAQIVFWGSRLAGRPDKRVREVLALPQNQAAYDAWFAFDLPIEPARTLVALFLERESARLTAGERRYLESMRDSHLRLYEVAEVTPEQGLHLSDLWSDERLWVRERKATHQLVRWDLLAARVVPGTGSELVLDGAPYLYPAGARAEMLKELRRAHRTFARRSPAADLTTFFKRVGVLFHHRWLDLVVFPPLPTFVTSEGDPVVFARVTFDVLDRPALVRALASHPYLEYQDDGAYAWLEDAPPGRRGLGTFVLKGERVVFETTSRERAERGRRLLEDVAGDAVKFRATRYEDVERALEKHRASPAPPPAERVPPEVEAQIVGEYYERHYRDWLDQPIPALGNRTPRHAARLKTMRPRLIALLKEFENRSARLRREGRAAYDFGWMWEALGLEHP